MISDSRRDKYIAKVGKVLTLHSRATDEERKTAYLMARKLMMKYHLDEDEIRDRMKNSSEPTVDDVAVFHETSKWYNIKNPYLYELYRLIFERMRCRVAFYEYSSRIWLPIVRGLNDDLEVALKVFYDAYYHCRVGGATEYTAHKQYGNIARNSYYYGFYIGLNLAYQRQDEELRKENDKYELVLTTPAVVDESHRRDVLGTVEGGSLPEVDMSSLSYDRGLDDGYELGSTGTVTSEMYVSSKE